MEYQQTLASANDLDVLEQRVANLYDLLAKGVDIGISREALDALARYVGFLKQRAAAESTARQSRSPFEIRWR